MPIEYVTDPRTGKVVAKGSLGFGQPVVPERPPAPRAKPKPKPKPKANNFWGVGPGGFSLSKLGNDLRYELNQLATDPLRSVERAASTTMRSTPAGIAFRQGSLGATAATANAVRAGIEWKQRAGGRKQTDYSTSPTGRAVDRVVDHVYRSAGVTPPSQMTPEEKGVDDLRSALTLGVAGGVGVGVGLKALSGVRFVGPAAQTLANAMNPALAKSWQGAVSRLAFDAAVGEAVTTPLDYTATGGSAVSLVDAVLGTKLDPVKPGMAFPDAAAASFIPNVAFGVGLGGAFVGINRARKARSVVQQTVEQPRAELEGAGLVQSDPDTGATAFTPEAAQGQSLREANAALEEKYGISAPEPAAAPEPAIPSQAMEPGGAVMEGDLPTADPGLDPWAIDYDPELPEADVAFSQIKNASDAELLDAVRSGGSVLEELDQRMASRQPLEPDPALSTELNTAPSDSLADPITPFAQQWQQLGKREPQQLLNVLHPEVNPDLAARAQALTGKEWEELTPADAVQTLQAAANDGSIVIPSRLVPGQQMMKTGDLKIDPARFQFKQGTDARGVQRGSSLEGVDRWNTDMEQPVEVWQDPADGEFYVVNGHNRFALAQAKGIPTLPIKEIFAESPEQAKTVGALSNIATGGGRPIDAAWFFKGAGITDTAQLKALQVPLAPDSGNGLSGFQLSRLPEDILRAVESGQIKERQGRLIGGSGADEASMRGAYRYLVENPGTTEGRLKGMLELSKQMTGEAQATGRVDQPDMLKGTDWDQTFNKQMVAVADLADEVATLLKREKRLFSMADANSAALEAKGSRIDKASAQQVAEANARAIDYFQRTWMETGPIRDLLNEGGNRVAAGENKGAIAKQIKNRLVGQLADLMGEQAITRADVVQEDLLAGGGQFLPDSQALLGEIDRAAAAYGESIDKGLEMSRQLGDAAAGLEAGARKLGDQASVIKELSDAPLDRLDPIDREAMEFFAIQRAIQNGEVRPPETPIPELPMDSGVDLMKVQRDLAENTITDDVVKAMADELDLRDAYRQLDETIAREAEKAARDAEGYDLKTFDEKKAAGVLEGFEEPPPGAAAAKRRAEEIDRLERSIRQIEQSRLPAAEERNPELAQQLRDHAAKLRGQLRELTGQDLAPPAAFTFPADLAKSAPRYGMAKVEFASDLDRAAYMLRDQAKKSKGESRLIQALEEAGYNITAIRTHGAKVRDAIKGIITEQTGSAAAPQKAMSLQVPEQRFGNGDLDSMRGWDYFDSSPMDMSPEGAALRRAGLLQIVREVVGDDVTVRLEDDYEIVTIKSEWGGDGRKQGVRKGFYRLTEDLIQINGVTRAASDAEIMPTAYHEAFHRLQYLSLGPKEAKVLDNTWARMKAAIGSDHVSGSKSGAAIAYAESQAVAFQRYAWARRNGQDPIRAMLGGYEPNADRLTKAVTTIISAFDRIFDVAEKLYNLFTIGAFDSARGIFERARSGSLGKNEFAFEEPSGGFDRMEASVDLLGWRSASWDGRKVGTGGKTMSFMVSEGRLVDELTQALDDTNPRTGLPRGLSRAAVKEAVSGRPSRALAESAQLAEARVADLNARIEAVKQRAAMEGC